VSIPSKASGWVEVKPPPPPPPANLAAHFVDRRGPWPGGNDLEALVEGVDEAFRLRWRWPDEYDQMAPDVREFHIHYLPGIPNVLQGQISQVGSESSGRTDVIVELAGLDAAPKDLLAGRLLSQEGKTFRIMNHTVGTSSGSTYKINVTLRLPDEPSENRPVTGACSVALEATVPVEVTSLNVFNNGFKATIESTSFGALPSSGLAGGSLVIPGVEASLDGANLDTVASDHIEMTVWGSLLDPAQRDRLLDQVAPFNAMLRLPPPDTAAYQDYSQVAAWPVTFDPTIPKTIVGGYYDLVLRRPVGEEPTGLTATEPGKYILVVGDSYPDLDVNSSSPLHEGQFGVSSEGLGGQGPVSAPAGVVRVFRGDVAEQAAVAAELQLPITAEEDFVLKGPPNFAGKLTYEFTFAARKGWRYEVFRALDETLFSVDRAVRQEIPGWEHPDRFIDEDAKDAWLDSFAPPPSPIRDAIEDLIIDPATLNLAAIEGDILHNSLLQALAGLPYNDRAFTRLNLDAKHLKPDENDPSIMICIDDTIEGRAAGRYFYRVQAYDSAGNAAPMAMASQPIYVRGDLRPAAPVITRVEGGDRQITIRWVANRDPTIKGYRVYRTDDQAKAGDWRRMDLLPDPSVEYSFKVPEPLPDPWPVEFHYLDSSVDPKKAYYYALIAVSEGENQRKHCSSISSMRVGRAFDDTHPDPPVWDSPALDSEVNSVVLSWTSPIPNLACLVQRSTTGVSVWTNISGWLERGTYSYADNTRALSETYNYRLCVLDQRGWQNRDFNTLTV